MALRAVKLACGASLWLVACASQPWAAAAAAAAATPTTLPLQTLVGTDGSSHSVPAVDGRAFTVLEFFSADCDIQRAHDARLAELAKRYAPRGVAFFAIDSESDSTLERDAQLAHERAYPYPILRDTGSRLARSLGAEYSTYSVIVDRQGHVRYRGGVDSDQVHLRSDTHAYLQNALDDLLSGREPHVSASEALGCGLRLER